MSEPREWISRIEDPLLRERVRKVLVDLMVISEAPASGSRSAPPDRKQLAGQKKGGQAAKAGKGSFSSSPPRGVFSRDGRSLLDLHSERIQGAVGDPMLLLRRVYQAEHDVMRAKWGPRDWRKGTDEDVERDYESDATFEARVIASYEGMDSVEVGIVYEERNPAIIEKVRRAHKRNPRDGTPLESWFTWSEEEKCAVIADLRARGKSQREVAAELGITKGPVQRRWEEEKAA